MKKLRNLLSLVLISLFLFGCAKDDTLPYQGDSPEYIYAIGHNFLKDHSYTKAIEAFRSLNAQYPFEKYSKLGMLEMIYAYYQKSDEAMAQAIAKQYIKLYPNSDNVGYAYYMLGIVNFNNGRGFLQKYLPYDMAKHDPQNYKKAFDDFDRAISLDPSASYVPDARRRMIYLVNVIAQYELNIAEYYYRKGAFVATINRAQKIIQHYPNSEQVEPALVIAAKSYKNLMLPKQATETMEVLKANFPNNAYLVQLEKVQKKSAVSIN
jgi:outer membrane protein assembly factor BamD